MKRDDGELRLAATDVTTFAACPHATVLDVAALDGRVKRPYFDDPAEARLREHGLLHEKRYLAKLRAEHRTVVELPFGGAPEESAARTVEAMRRGVDVIYQGTLLRERWLGRPDFLVRVETPSALGAFSYEVIDTKLARSARPGAVLQICFYVELLAHAQGRMPDRMRLVLGDGREETFLVARYGAYFRRVRASLSRALASPALTYPEPVAHCDVCDWSPLCDARRHDDDHLSLVPGILARHRRALEASDVRTVRKLALLSATPTARIEGIGAAALVRIREQARVQVEGRERGAVIHELLPESAEACGDEPPHGLALLPAPSPGDLFVDIEGDPYALADGLEYLLGIASLDAAGAPVYRAEWALDRAEERAAFERFVREVMERRARFPDMHVYHYGAYEPTAWKRLAGRFAACVDELDALLRGEVFVDLHRVVRRSLRASVESYSIKRIEPLYAFSRAVPLREATRALIGLEGWLELGGAAPPAAIAGTVESYNRDDCLSTHRLRAWLEEQRRALEARRGAPLPRPSPKPEEPSDALAEQVDRVRARMRDLLAGVPLERDARTDDEQARWLLAHLLEWHRREEKSSHWEYFRLAELTDEELLEEKAPLSGLIYEGEAGTEKRSVVHRYRFPPQDHALDRARNIHDPRTRASAGTLHRLDDAAGIVEMKRLRGSDVPHPTALIPRDLVPSVAQQESLLRLGDHVAQHGAAPAAPHAAALSLLARRPPESLTPDRDGMVLPLQGPPGTGKTHRGAQMIVDLIQRGKRVGITANSHKVITHLLDRACRAAAEQGVSLRAVQRASEEEGSSQDRVTLASNEEIPRALASGAANLAAGTAWLWSRADLASSVDVLFVDEAGQMTLANVVACAHAARSLVLLGDPQQLDQPVKGVHPPGTATSALGHVLDGAATLRAEQGLFLDQTWRMHPDVCAFISEVFYEGRLRSRPELARLRLEAPPPLDGTGLRFLPVRHRGNQSESREEARAVAALVARLTGGRARVTDRHGESRALTLDDIVIVTPYNAQVALLRAHVPGARVGTVDKFQGQEAPVVIYSMATSTPDEAPRGAEFLYSSNRLNVAISRAQHAAFLVASPDLFDLTCRTERQMELVNAFCRYLELARVIDLADLA